MLSDNSMSTRQWQESVVITKPSTNTQVSSIDMKDNVHVQVRAYKFGEVTLINN